MSVEKFELLSLRVQNLRGFTDTELRLDEPTIFLVGPNNSGKTSLLTLFDVLFNWDLRDELVRGVSEDLLGILLPQRDTRNAARRLTLCVRVSDGRRHSALQCKQGVASLRLSLTLNDRRLRANLGDPRKGEDHDSRAEDFLFAIRDSFCFAHIPAGRSADSSQFSESLLEAVTASLSATLQQPGKGATKTERDAMAVLGRLEQLAGPVSEFWQNFLGRLPHGWILGADSEPAIDRTVLSRFIVEQLSLSVSTGQHDVSGVQPAEVGSGLQSLLDLELRRSAAEATGRSLLLGIEEPEAFLHPSAQRQLGRKLSETSNARMIVSTHSALIVEEAESQQVAIVRDHKVSQSTLRDDLRAAINTSLMAGRGAEVLFARSVLLVEGPGDREYWESLRRRVARFDPSGAIDQCYVLDIGANNRSAPWIRLFRSYKDSPLRWTLLLDSDSTSELREAATAAGFRLAQRQSDQLGKIRQAISDNDLVAVEQNATGLARVVAGEQSILLAPGDLEAMMCAGLSTTTAGSICDELGFDERLTADKLATRLGTKHRAGGKSTQDPPKSPWMRSVIAQLTPADEVSDFVGQVLELWLAAACDQKTAKKAVRSFRTSTI